MCCLVDIYIDDCFYRIFILHCFLFDLTFTSNPNFLLLLGLFSFSLFFFILFFGNYRQN